MGLDLGSSLPHGLTNLLQQLLLLRFRPPLLLRHAQDEAATQIRNCRQLWTVVHAWPVTGDVCCKLDMWLQPPQAGASQLTWLAYVEAGRHKPGFWS